VPIVEVEAMSEQPGTCFHCGGSPTVDDEIQHPIIEFQGIDINWGDTPYLCAECVGILCDLVGRVTVKEHEDVVGERDQLSEKLQGEQEAHQALQERVNRMLDGAKARREAKEAAVA
jgi:hypothetical protein